MTLSWLPEFTAATGAPRVAGIAYPGNQPLGPPGDADSQRDVLRATLALLESMDGPGTVQLPFAWPGTSKQARNKPRRPPPIARLILKRPWLLRNLLKGRIPER